MGRRVRVVACTALVLVALSTGACSGRGTSVAGGDGTSRSCPRGITIGFFGALTGKAFSEIGIGEANATQLAIEQFNRTHSRCRVGYRGFDSQGDAAQAPGQAQLAIRQTDVVALIGPAFSGESQVADPIFDRAGLPTITVSATFPQLSQYGWKVFHRAVANDNAQAPAVARYMSEILKAKKVAVIDDGGDYGKTLGEAVRQNATALGVSVVNLGSIDTGHQSQATVGVVKEAANAMKTATVDVVFYAGLFDEAGPLLKQLRGDGVTATFMSGDRSLDARFVATASPAAAEGAVLTAPTAYVQGWAPSDQGFVNAYRARFNTLPGIYTAEAYDATNHLLAAIQAGRHTRAEVNSYLSTTPYRGMLKTYDYGPDGELRGPPRVFLYRVVNGQITLVAAS
jgi:branched-chain amino acid transport system substrate-binding protein